ncbi:SusC/RagA family TonB-linked outer membrane protein [Parapedobacter soli]|uniref:SusC/RagA family TonB-linked outer membrane protein n=1 Tax=Parapedobacter soli TaxID=416955 RepID=UPI0021C8BE99|nr:TonB-dependent receptor [Parapedobacter soli]
MRKFYLFLLVIAVMVYGSDPYVFAQQSNVVRGTVNDASTGEPIAGVSVSERGGGRDVQTDDNGTFELALAPGANAVTLVFSYVGYQTVEREAVSGEPVIIALTPDNNLLEEAVAIGYGTVSRKDLAGAVSSIKGSELAQAPVVNVAEALTGRFPGVQVTSVDGSPGAEIIIRVRGGGSITQDNSPLYIVDGFIVDNINDIAVSDIESIDVLKDASSTAIYGSRGANGVVIVTTKSPKAGRTNINYNNFFQSKFMPKELDVLSPYEFALLHYEYGVLRGENSSEYTNFKKFFGEYDDLELYKYQAGTNWQRELFGGAVHSAQHNLSMTGGTDLTKIWVSASYMDEDGMKLMSYAKRAAAMFKMDQKIRDNLNLNLTLRYTDRRSLGNEGTTSGAGSILSSAYRFRPIRISDIKGDLSLLTHATLGEEATVMYDVTNPVNRTNDVENLALDQHFLGTTGATWNIVPNLTYFSELTLARSYSIDRNWSGPTTDANFFVATGTMETIDRVLFAGNADYRKNDRWNLRWTNTLNYDVLQTDKHRLNILAGQEFTNSGGTDMRINALRFPANFTKENAFAMMNQYDSSVATNLTVATGVSTPGRIISYFGRGNYSFLDRYLFTVTMRADGSSNFSPEHRWGYFPAGAVAWRISNERFMENVSWIDDLKLRASYGEVGNDAVDPNQWSQLWRAETDTRRQAVLDNAIQPAYDLAADQMANSDLKWETTITRNLGLDFTLLQNRLWGSVEVYKNNTRDLLMLTDIPSITGFTTSYANVGQTSNRGVELSLSGTLFQNDDWQITAGGNINFNKSNIDELADGVQSAYGTSFFQSRIPESDYLLKEGKPVGIVMGFRTVDKGYYETSDFNYDAATGMYTLKDGVPDLAPAFVAHHKGVVPAGQQAYPGMPKLFDRDGDGVINTDDYVEIGNMTPKHTGGFNLTVKYKRVDLGAYFNWSYGNEIYNANKLASLYNGNKGGGLYGNKLDIVNDGYRVYDIDENRNLVRVTDPAALDALNKNATLPLTYMHQGYVSDIGIEDGSYLRLNTLTLGYSMPNQLLSKAGLSALRIYGTVYNVMTLTGYSGIDPEINSNPNINNSRYPTPGFDWGTYPRPRQFVIGLNASF